MSYYPDYISARDLCVMEGCEFGDGGSCRRCGERLRCVCGQFVTVASLEGPDFTHLKKCPTILNDRLEERREIEVTFQ